MFEMVLNKPLGLGQYFSPPFSCILYFLTVTYMKIELYFRTKQSIVHNDVTKLLRLLYTTAVYATLILCFCYTRLPTITMFAVLMCYLHFQQIPYLVYIFMAGTSIQHVRRTVISLHPCHKFHSYVYLEFAFVPEKHKQGKVSIPLLFYSARIDKFTHFLGTRQKVLRLFKGKKIKKFNKSMADKFQNNESWQYSGFILFAKACLLFCYRSSQVKLFDSARFIIWPVLS